ncbi:MAG: hypothetical protein IT168_14320 [Bryobacterales bacterium]|nr:hypothetical protein [Bryobacterales bacterium]
MPGALVKAQLVSEAEKRDSSFNEREYGLKNFLEFVKTVPAIAVQIRIGSDMLLAPATAGDLLSAYARPLPRLRRDFWRAFIEFPIPGTTRLYDTVEDKIVVEQSPTARKGIIIEPISRETQITWRRAFAEEQPESVRGSLLGSLDGAGSSVFNEFARRLRENPTVMHAWNRFLQKQITDHVAAWAQANGVPEERWCSGTSRSEDGSSKEPMPLKTHSIGQRAELYNFLDNVPIEDLLQLRVPLEWVLKVTRDKR